MIRDRIKELRRVKASELREHPLNWRHHPERQKTSLRAMIDEIGFASALIAYETEDGSLQLIDGHLRRDSAADDVVPVLVLDVNEEEAKRLLLTIDPLAAMAEAGEAELERLLAGLDISGEHYQEILSEYLADVEIPIPDSAELVDVDTPEIPAEPITKPGDLWTLGRHRLLCGDSTIPADVYRLIGDKRAEMMFADPPYGVDYTGGRFHSEKPNVDHKRPRLAGDKSADVYGRFLPVAAKVVDGPSYLWFAGRLGDEVFRAVAAAGGVVSALIIWHKTNATYAAMNAHYKQRHEPCLYFKFKGSSLRWSGPTDASTIWEFKKEGINKLHPTQKPIDLVAFALKNHDAKTVFDPFSGSGTVLSASEQLGKRCLAMEIDPGYCDVAIARWETLTGQKATRASG